MWHVIGEFGHRGIGGCRHSGIGGCRHSGIGGCTSRSVRKVYGGGIGGSMVWHRWKYGGVGWGGVVIIL